MQSTNYAKHSTALVRMTYYCYYKKKKSLLPVVKGSLLVTCGEKNENF